MSIPPPPYRVMLAPRPIPVVASLPHSGLFVPDAMRERLRPEFRSFLPHQDWHLDRLYRFLPGLGVSTICATHSRYVVDPNRALGEPRLGSFWRAVAPESTPRNEPIYLTQPDGGEVGQRVTHVYQPYHDRLRGMLAGAIGRWGRVYLLDLHSFGLPGDDEICLGDANGTSCGEAFVAAVEVAFLAQGFRVLRNKPFNGGHITRRYAEMEGVQALQIEASYALYLSAAELSEPVTPSPDVDDLALALPRFRRACERLLAGFEDWAAEPPAAAAVPSQPAGAG